MTTLPLAPGRQVLAGWREPEARRPLVVGVGNPLRGDDGAGPAVAERAAAHPALAGATVQAVHQLTPELAADLAGASVAVLVDALAGVVPGRVSWSRVGAGPAAPAPLTHHLRPEALAGLATLAYGRVPPTFVVTVGAAGFEPGAPLSAPVRAALAAAAGTVVALVSGHPDGAAPPPHPF